MLKGAEQILDGPVDEVLREDRLTALYGVPIQLGRVGGQRMLVVAGRETPMFEAAFMRVALAASIAVSVPLSVIGVSISRSVAWSFSDPCWRKRPPWGAAVAQAAGGNKRDVSCSNMLVAGIRSSNRPVQPDSLRLRQEVGAWRERTPTRPSWVPAT